MWCDRACPVTPHAENGDLMTVQTLVVTTDQTDHALPERMNIQTDAIIGNQCGRHAIDEFEYDGHKMQMICSRQRGVGINRNEVMMRADADICVLADDDMTFLTGYEAAVCGWFERLPDADMLIFNLEGGKKRHRNTKVCRVNRVNYGKYGTARLAFRTRAVRFSGVLFHTMFGGGAEYCCGEDTLFLMDCLRKGLKIYGVPDSIAQISDVDSTWFQGYTDKFFFDKGVLYYALNKRLCTMHAVIHCLHYRKKYCEYGWRKALKQMQKGIRAAK